MHGIKTVPVEPVCRYGICLLVASRRNKNIEVLGSLISVEMSSCVTASTKRADSSYFVYEIESCPMIAKSRMNIGNITEVLGNPRSHCSFIPTKCKGTLSLHKFGFACVWFARFPCSGAACF